LPNRTVFERESLSRRRFLQGSAVTAGIVAASPYLSMLQAFAAPPVAATEGILVTILLSGGNDGLNMVAPVGDPAYAALRPTLHVTHGHPLGHGFAFHPALTTLKARFDQGKVAIVRGVGYRPPDLSHFSSTDTWMHGWGGTASTTTGWLGRYLDGLPDTAHQSLYGVGLSGGVNPHLSGAVSQASSLPLSISGAFGIDRTDRSDVRMYDEMIRTGNAATGLGALGDQYAVKAKEFLQLAQRIRPAYGFKAPATDLAQQLVLGAHLINANLGIRVIDTALGGFDTHANQTDSHATLMSQLDRAVDEFYSALNPRWRTQVTLMTFSEFGRRPEENGDRGTDHGTAAPLLMIGDRVKGGLHGTHPSLTQLDSAGNLVPTVDFRAVFATVLHDWLGANAKTILGKTYSALSLFRPRPTTRPSAAKTT
jgi:uncharacterized protein (DUF1501 family)